jgi:hypothetical protein
MRRVIEQSLCLGDASSCANPKTRPLWRTCRIVLLASVFHFLLLSKKTSNQAFGVFLKRIVAIRAFSHAEAQFVADNIEGTIASTNKSN